MTIIYFFLAALALGILILIHELGHFIAAKKVGMSVESFSIGFGPAIFSKKLRGVEWRIGIIPFGGYVRIAGMDTHRRKGKEDIDPYIIPSGFFSKSPFKRIIVLAAGPVANILLAFLVFGCVSLLGGRVKNFSEFTQVVGWINSDSNFYKKGLRAGDVVTSLDERDYNGTKDLIYATVSQKDRLNITGFRPGFGGYYEDKQVFDYWVTSNREGFQKVPFLGASYLIYDGSKLPEGSPMRSSGIQAGDQIVWVDGEFIFSLEALSVLLNSNYTLLTVERNKETFLIKQPRILAGDLMLPDYLKHDLMDWQYEAHIRGKWNVLWLIPYHMNINGYIEGSLESVNANRSNGGYQPLEIGDRIIAVDGFPISNGYDLLEKLQQRSVSIIVKRKNNFDIKSITEEDLEFINTFDFNEMKSIIKGIGLDGSVSEFGDYNLLRPVHPRTWDEFDLSLETREKLTRQKEEQQREILKIRNKTKRSRYLELWELSQKKALLGISLKDREVRYNPGVWGMVNGVFGESFRTLKALVTGNLSPKWLSGPVGIVQTLHYGWSLGITEALFWVGLISINLAVLNLLPIPALDGGYILMCLWEFISGKKLNLKLMERVLGPFVFLLILLFVFLTFQDLFRLFS
ncbi:MAG: site-2 protease family protein [Victivallaceae bacterium]